MQQIANILFDFGNVIIDIDIPGASSRLAQLRDPKIPEPGYVEHLHDLVRKYEVDKISTEVFINGVLKHARQDVQALDVIEAWNSMLVGIPDYRLEMLEQLRGHYNLLLLSNTNFLHIGWVHDHLVQMHGIRNFETRFFDVVYYSHLIKRRKPDAATFRYVIEDALITPRKTLFIDDTEENIEAARKLGFQVLYSPPEEEVAEALKIGGFF